VHNELFAVVDTTITFIINSNEGSGIQIEVEEEEELCNVSVVVDTIL